MGFFTSNKKDKKTIILFSIGSGSVTGGIVEFTRKPNGELAPTILGQARTHISFQEELDFDKFFFDMQKALQETAEKLYNLRKGAPDHIYCTLGSPWFISETRTLRLEKKAPFVVTQSLIDDLIDTELKNIVKTYQIKYQDVSAQPKLLEGKVLHSALNGYEVIDPIGKKTSTLDLNLFVSVSPDVCINGIEASIKKVFHTKHVSYMSFVSALFIVARDKYINVQSYLLVDINSEITDIGVVANGVFDAMVSFPVGKNHVIREISSKLSKDEKESRSLFNMMSEKTLEESLQNKINVILKDVTDEWKKQFKITVSSLPQSISLPSTVFLVADNDCAEHFANVLKQEDPTLSISDRKFTVITIDGPSLLDMCKITSGTCEQFLMVEAIALSRILKDNF